MLKLIFHLLLRASLISLVICGLSLIAEAAPSAKIFEFRPSAGSQTVAEIKLKTLEESILELTNTSEKTKEALLSAIDHVGAYQFPSEYVERSKIDSLIMALLSLPAFDAEVTAAASAKLAELSHTIFNRSTRDSFIRFLNYQLQQQIPKSQVGDWGKFLSLFENSKHHASQLDMLHLFYKKSTDNTIRTRAFNQIYSVLVDPDLHWSGQFSPTFLRLMGLRLFVSEDLMRQRGGSASLSNEQYQRILDLVVKVEEGNQVDPISHADLTRILMKLAEIRVEFEERVILRINRLAQFDQVLKDFADQINKGELLTAVQQNILKKLKLKSEEMILLRKELLGEAKPSNVIQFKRAAPACHSFYGL